MTIPTSPLYPNAFDTDTNLYFVRDSLQLRLAEDYTPGDTSITVYPNVDVLALFPSTGVITLTEQCSDIEDRAISFFYGSIDVANSQFNDLELLLNFTDVVKPKRITNVTQNVMAHTHNNIKDALIAIEEFIGVKGTTDLIPFGETLEGRINFLRTVALQPRAWFKSDKRVGIVPLEVTFTDQSFRLGTDGDTGVVTITYDFGDNTTSIVSLISTVSATSNSPNIDNIFVYDMDGGEIKKTYYNPGFYSVSVTVKNDFGTDICRFENYINARVPAPQEAVIKFVVSDGQTVTPGVPTDGPYEVLPKIRSPINTIIEIEVPDGENPSNSGFSYAGEVLNINSNPIDSINVYTWALGDDLLHANSPNTKAAYGQGGIYDLKLRVDTEFGAYRITTYEDCIDIVENINLWLLTFDDVDSIRAWEYGLISETFKVNSNSSYTITRDDSFLDDVPESDKQKQEFNRNVGFTPRGSLPSGTGGSALLFWATGRAASDPVSEEQISVVEYSGFTDTYITRTSLDRQWNWCNLSSSTTSFFAFGVTSDSSPNTSPTNLDRIGMNLVSFDIQSRTLTNDDFKNGASELSNNAAQYNNDGESIYGNFSVYRTAWKDNSGYIARNDGVGPFFRMKSFYRTEGSIGSPFTGLRKLTDIQGPTKVEGQLTTLSNGIYFFNNSGSISAFNDSTNSWSTGGPGVNSVAYRALQDTEILGFDNSTNTLLAASDGDHRAYLSFDYSTNVFIKFNQIDLTFVSLGIRPEGSQLVMGIH